MPMQRYRTRSVPVLAVQFTGFNLCELEEAGAQRLSSQLEVGSWLVVDPDDGRWQILPNKVFERVYIVDHSGPMVYKDAGSQTWPRVCFNCIHYTTNLEGTRSICSLFQETIQNELIDAEDCAGYEQWRP